MILPQKSAIEFRGAEILIRCKELGASLSLTALGGANHEPT